MGLFLPRRWRRQPLGFFRIDYSGLGASCTFFFYKVGDTWVDAATGILPTTETGTTAPYSFLGKPGTAGNYSGTTGTVFPDHPRHNMLGEMSLISALNPRTASTYGLIIQKGLITSNQNCPYALRLGSTKPTVSELLFLRANASTYRYWLPTGIADRVPAGTQGFVGITAPALIESSPTFYFNTGEWYLAAQQGISTGTATGAATTDNASTYIGKRPDGVVALDGLLFYVAGFNTQLSDGAMRALFENPWQILVPLRRPVLFIGGPVGVVGSAKSAGGGATKATGATTRAGAAKSAGGGATKATGVTARAGSAKSAGGGAAKSQGTSATPTVGSAKAAGGGASGSVGATARTGTATSSGGGSARAQGAAAVLHTAAAAGGGAAIPAGRGSPGHTSVGSASAGGGAARAIGVQNVGILGTARAAGGGCAISPTLANRIGWAVAGGGGAARATAQSATHSGTARAAGGGAARAFGATTPPPSNVDHYIHGWPVSQSGAVIVRIMP